MRLTFLFSVLFVAACSGASPFAEPPKSPVEIEFQYAPSWHDETLIYLARLHDGTVYCSVQTRPQFRESGSPTKWKTIKEVVVSPQDFARIENEFDTPELRNAAGHDWSAIPDGSRWLLRKKVGAWTAEIAAWNPDIRAEGSPIVHLAQAISSAAKTQIISK